MQNYILFFKNMLFVKRKKETKKNKTKKTKRPLKKNYLLFIL